MTVLDKPAQTARLIAALRAAVPFDVELPLATLVRLKAKNPALVLNGTQIVHQVTYEPSYGGIVCLIMPDGTDELIATSLTHVRVHRSKPFAAAVADYQKHRMKKLRQKRAKTDSAPARLAANSLPR